MYSCVLTASTIKRISINQSINQDIFEILVLLALLLCFICSICNFSVVQLSFYLPVVQLFYLVSLSHMYIICAFIAIIIIISSFIIEVAL